VQEAARLGAPLRLSASSIDAIVSTEYPTVAVRPLNSRLDCGKLCTTFAIDLPDWRDAALPVLTRLLHTHS
jgi:dTDP-4-dehydrorhamnose reductase